MSCRSPTATPELRRVTGDAHEPYRELLRGVRARMAATRRWIEASLEQDDDRPAERCLSSTFEISKRRCASATSR